MPRDLFADVVAPSFEVGTKKWYTMPLSIGTHGAVLLALVVVPLMATDVLPTPRSVMAFAAVPPAPPPPPPPPPAASAAPTPSRPVAHVSPVVAPVEEPPAAVKPEPPPPTTIGGVVGGVVGGIPGGTLGGVTSLAPPPPSGPVHVGRDVREPKLVKKVPPIYPASAQTAKVQGVVIIEAIIGKDGSVKDARVTKSVALLDQAALDAVKQWRFIPTQLNGYPVEVVCSLTVTFTLLGQPAPSDAR